MKSTKYKVVDIANEGPIPSVFRNTDSTYGMGDPCSPGISPGQDNKAGLKDKSPAGNQDRRSRRLGDATSKMKSNIKIAVPSTGVSLTEAVTNSAPDSTRPQDPPAPSHEMTVQGGSAESSNTPSSAVVQGGAGVLQTPDRCAGDEPGDFTTSCATTASELSQQEAFVQAVNEAYARVFDRTFDKSLDSLCSFFRVDDRANRKSHESYFNKRYGGLLEQIDPVIYYLVLDSIYKDTTLKFREKPVTESRRHLYRMVYEIIPDVFDIVVMTIINADRIGWVECEEKSPVSTSESPLPYNYGPSLDVRAKEHAKIKERRKDHQSYMLLGEEIYQRIVCPNSLGVTDIAKLFQEWADHTADPEELTAHP